MRVLLVLLALVSFVPGQDTRSLRFAWDLHPSHDGASFELEVDGAAVVPCGDLAVLSTERQCTAVVPGVAKTFRLRGRKVVDGKDVIGAWSGSVGGGGTGSPPGTFTITRHHVPPIPTPPPVSTSAHLAGGFALSCCRLTAEATMTARVTAPAGSLLVAAIRLPDSHTAAVQGIQGAGTWTPVERPRGSGSVTVGFELWWAEADGTQDAAITISEPRPSWTWTVIPFAVAGTGAIDVAASDRFIKTIADRQHPSSTEGVHAQPGDVMVSGGTTFSTVGNDERSAEGWTLEEEIGTRGITQYRLPTEPVTNDRAIWSAENPRLAVSAVVVFRRQ